MKKTVVLTCSILFFASLVLAQGIEFHHGTWAEALEAAKKENKIIFVDAYAKWCGPCKRMAATTFVDQSVGEFFNANFINVKMDMEEGEGPSFGNKFPVSAYPTLMFIDPNGEKLVKKAVGAQQVDGLMQLGTQVLGSSDQSPQLAKEWEAGKRDPEFVLTYIRALNKAGKPSLKITNEYLNAQKDLGTEPNLRIIFEGATEADSRIFDLLIKNKGAISALMTEKVVNDRIENACKNTAKKATEFKDENLMKEAKTKLKANCPDRAETAIPQLDMKYYVATNQPEEYIKACRAAIKSHKDDPAKNLGMAEQITRNFGNHPGCMKEAERMAQIAAEKGAQCQYYMTYAEILKRNGKKNEAIAAAEKAVSLAKEKSPALLPQAEHMLKGLKGA